MTAEETKIKLAKFIDPKDAFGSIKSPSPEKLKKSLQFSPSPRSPAERSQQDFNRSLGSNYFDDELPQNQAVAKNEL